MATQVLGRLYTDGKSQSKQVERSLTQSGYKFEKAPAKEYHDVVPPSLLTPEGQFNGVEAIKTFIQDFWKKKLEYKVIGFEKEYECKFEIFEGKIKSRTDEDFGMWDNYIEWKACLRYLQKIQKIEESAQNT